VLWITPSFTSIVRKDKDSSTWEESRAAASRKKRGELPTSAEKRRSSLGRGGEGEGSKRSKLLEEKTERKEQEGVMDLRREGRKSASRHHQEGTK